MPGPALPVLTDSVAVQEEHDLADLHSFMPSLRDPLPALWPDPINRFQVSRVIAYHFQYFRAEVADQLFRQHWPNPFYKASAKVPFNTLTRGRRRRFQELGLELKPMLFIPDPPTPARQPFPGAD